jgi:hypothetical protein
MVQGPRRLKNMLDLAMIFHGLATPAFPHVRVADDGRVPVGPHQLAIAAPPRSAVEFAGQLT